MKKLLPLCLLLSACATAPSRQPGAVKAAWVEAGPKLLARAVAEGGCPELLVDGQTLPMNPRSAPSEKFPVSVCERELPSAYHDAHVGPFALPRWNPNPAKILFLGDTGCRVSRKKDGSMYIQACNDPEKWPFATVAKTAANWKPDLVVHVGDYHYREADCPSGEPSCAGLVSGDRWESWRQDFFAPGAPLLAAAPWVFVRGNHELCEKAGSGFLLLLDPRPAPAACADVTPPYSVAFAGHRLNVIDSADDANIAPSLNAVAASSKEELAWLALHRPFLTPGLDDEAKGATKLPARLSGPGALAAVFSGHRHILSLNRFTDERPPELITGNGGDRLETVDKNPKSVKSARYGDFGFLSLTRDPARGSAWHLEEHDKLGAVVLSCRLRERAGRKTDLTCEEQR